MGKNFKLNGSIEARFKQIELVLPRIMSHMSTKTYGVIPASIVTNYVKLAYSKDTLFNGAMFAGKVKKVLFKLASFEGEGKPSYLIRIKSENKENKFSVETKKLIHIMEIDLDIADGDVITITQENSNITLNDVYLSALISLAKGYDEVREFVTEELLESIEDERI
jgi:hypothetical protein